MQYLGTKCYTDPEFPDRILAPVRNKPGLRLLLPTNYENLLRPIEIYQDKAGGFRARWVTGKQRPLADIIPPPHQTVLHLIRE